MCRIEEHTYIGADGSRSKSEDIFPCNKARSYGVSGKLCDNVVVEQRRTSEVFPKANPLSQNVEPSAVSQDANVRTYRMPNPIATTIDHFFPAAAATSFSSPLNTSSIRIPSNPPVKGEATYRWICCQCGEDNSYDYDAGCNNCFNHWRRSCCTVYKLEPDLHNDLEDVSDVTPPGRMEVNSSNPMRRQSYREDSLAKRMSAEDYLEWEKGERAARLREENERTHARPHQGQSSRERSRERLLKNQRRTSTAVVHRPILPSEYGYKSRESEEDGRIFQILPARSTRNSTTPYNVARPRPSLYRGRLPTRESQRAIKPEKIIETGGKKSGKRIYPSGRVSTKRSPEFTLGASSDEDGPADYISTAATAGSDVEIYDLSDSEWSRSLRRPRRAQQVRQAQGKIEEVNEPLDDENAKQTRFELTPIIVRRRSEEVLARKEMERAEAREEARRQKEKEQRHEEQHLRKLASESQKKGILRKPTAKFPEYPEPIREGIVPLKDALKGKDIPIGARWTRIDRRLVNPEALEEAKERFEERMDCVIVLRVLSKNEIQKLADRTKQIRQRNEREREEDEHAQRVERLHEASAEPNILSKSRRLREDDEGERKVPPASIDHANDKFDVSHGSHENPEIASHNKLPSQLGEQSHRVRLELGETAQEHPIVHEKSSPSSATTPIPSESRSSSTFEPNNNTADTQARTALAAPKRRQTHVEHLDESLRPGSNVQGHEESEIEISYMLNGRHPGTSNEHPKPAIGASILANRSRKQFSRQMTADNDGYSYTDPASMYRAWRRSRAGSLDRTSLPRSQRMNNRAPGTSMRNLGPPPSTRGFDKINRGFNKIDNNASRSLGIDSDANVTGVKYKPPSSTAASGTELRMTEEHAKNDSKLQFLDHNDAEKDTVIQKKAKAWANLNKKMGNNADQKGGRQYKLWGEPHGSTSDDDLSSTGSAEAPLEGEEDSSKHDVIESSEKAGDTPAMDGHSHTLPADLDTAPSSAASANLNSSDIDAKDIDCSSMPQDDSQSAVSNLSSMASDHRKLAEDSLALHGPYHRTESAPFYAPTSGHGYFSDEEVSGDGKFDATGGESKTEEYLKSSQGEIEDAESAKGLQIPSALKGKILADHSTVSDGFTLADLANPDKFWEIEAYARDMRYRAKYMAAQRQEDERMTEAQKAQAEDSYEDLNVAPPSMQEVNWDLIPYGKYAAYGFSDSSRPSSYAASVLSTASLASSATDLSKHTGYSPMQIARATKELIVILQDDADLAPLYKRAIADSSIGPDKLQRNLRRLFRTYADHLSKVASDTLELLASQLVRAKAKDVAHSIIQKYSSTANTEDHKEKRQDRGQDQDQSSDEETESRPVDESVFDDLIVFREFLVSSEAYVMLHTQIRSFILPKYERQGLIEVSAAEEVGCSAPAAPVDEDHVANPMAAATEAASSQKWIERTKRNANAALVAAGYLEPPLEPGFTRLRWQCRCGDSFYGDVVEYREGGLARYIERMQRSTGVKVVATSYSQNTSNQNYTTQASTWMRTTMQKLSAAFGRSKKSRPGLPRHNTLSTTSTAVSHGSTTCPQQTLHFMACMQGGRYRRIVHQDPIDDIATDKELFLYMRQQVTKRRGRIRRAFSLKCIQGLYFVKFRLWASGDAEVREHKPCCTDLVPQTCLCIPPADKVEPSKDAEYRCTPAGPLDVGPPVLSQHMMHMLTSPECIHVEETLVVDQLPKRTCGKLEGKVRQPAEGWGLHFQEGQDFGILVGVVFIGLVASLLFAVLWSHFKHDVQGAFGVASYIVTAVAAFVALVVNRAGRLG